MTIEEVIAMAIYGETDDLALEVGKEVIAALKAAGLVVVPATSPDATDRREE